MFVVVPYINPPEELDVTHSQFLSGVLQVLIQNVPSLHWLPYLGERALAVLFIHSWRKKCFSYELSRRIDI